MAATWLIPLFSGALKASGAQDEAEDRALDLEDQAETAEQNAYLAKTAAQYNAKRIATTAQKVEGGIEADYAASGISSDSLSALEVLRESHTNAELDRQNVLFAGDVRYQDLKRRAANARSGAGRVREAGRLNVFTSLLGGAFDAADRYGGKNNSSEFRKGNLKADSGG